MCSIFPDCNRFFASGVQKVGLFAPKNEHDGCKMYVFSHTGVWEIRFFAPMVFIWLSALHQAFWRNSVTGYCADTSMWHFIRTTFRHWSTVSAATRCIVGNFLCFSQLSQRTSMSHILCAKRVQLWVFGRQELIYKKVEQILSLRPCVGVESDEM